MGCSSISMPDFGAEFPSGHFLFLFLCVLDVSPEWHVQRKQLKAFPGKDMCLSIM